MDDRPDRTVSGERRVVPQPVRSGLRPARRPSIERSAGGVVVRRIEGRVHALLIRDPYENWGLPKGHLERGEGAREAALREVGEETGLESVRIGADLGSIDWYFRHRGQVIHKFCTFYLMTSSRGDVCPAVDEGITRCSWVALDEAVERISYDNAREILRRAIAIVRSPGSLAGDL
jgi:ADP-ribose pyrophosphatase YjhB (NUDIX family)